jgi:iron(II)-dependent oxidoreductase
LDPYAEARAQEGGMTNTRELDLSGQRVAGGSGEDLRRQLGSSEQRVAGGSDETLAGQLAHWVRDARDRTLELVADLTDEQMLAGPCLPIVNPFLWEIGHVAWFQERWVLRYAGGQPPIRADADALYDSMAIPHDTRWGLPLPSRADTLAYLYEVRDRVLARLRDGDPGEAERYVVLLALFHEDMHDEAFTYMRQTFAYPVPHLSIADGQAGVSRPRSGSSSLRGDSGGPLPGDVEVPGGTFLFGALPGEPFVFDNEKWAHPVEVRPFAIARAAVTQAEFAAFVEDGGYRRPDLWSEEGWRWREAQGAEHPVYWRRAPGGGFLRRNFDAWVPLEPHRPVIHVSWYEADAFCRWAGRRLPSEVEWEVAASAEPDPSGRRLSSRKRRFPWGDEPAGPDRANLDWRAMGCLDVGALPAGDSAFGCRQMIGNVWEWTATDFLPFPGFVPDLYKEYSQPWFGTRKVLRGGCWVTRGRMLRNTWRNFFTPDRRDVLAGFRTCAADR